MKPQYWPMAIALQKNDEPRLLFTSDSTLQENTALKQYKIWKEAYNFELAAFCVDRIDREKKTRSYLKTEPRLIRRLWESLGNVPINPKNETLDARWGGFYPNTKRENIWHWFEDRFDIKVADLMYPPQTAAIKKGDAIPI